MMRRAKPFNVPDTDSERSIGLGRDFGIWTGAEQFVVHAVERLLDRFYFEGGAVWCLGNPFKDRALAKFLTGIHLAPAAPRPL